MKIKNIKDPIVFVALRRISEYIVHPLWAMDIGANDEVEYEYKLAVARSKRLKKDIILFSEIDLESGWEPNKTNPWYSGELSLEEFINAVNSLYEFLATSWENSIGETEFIHYFELLQKYDNKQTEDINFWSLIHPEIKRVAQPRFNSHHYADSVLTAFIEIEDKVRTLIGEDLSGSPLMQKAFSPQNPLIILDEIDTRSGKDLQRGYMELFSGAMLAIRNPKAHKNLLISKENAIHLLFIASTLIYNIENAAQVRIDKAEDELIINS